MKNKLLQFLVLILAMRVAWAEPQKESLGAMATVKVPTAAYGRYLEVSQETRKLRDGRDTAGLEQLAAKLRASKEALDGGTWLLSTFYDCLTDLSDDEKQAGEEMAFFEKWAGDRPQSITAQVALADAYTSYAWLARGSGWASSVGKEGWRLFRERLTKAWDVLEKAASLEEKCPGWYQVAQTVALGQGWRRQDYMEMMDKALAAEPTYGRYVTNTCYWLLPRWNGETGDFEKWLARLDETQPEKTRDRYYAFLVWMADVMPVGGEVVFTPGRLDWAKTKRGFEVRLAEDPNNLMVRLEYIRLGLLANDRKTVREQFEITGPKYFPAMWKGPQGFRQAWNFAFKDGPNPLLTEQRAEKLRLDPEQLKKVEFAILLSVKIIGGFLAGLLLFVLALQRREVWAGVAAFLASIVLAAVFGTASSILPAAALWFYLRRQPAQPRPDRIFSGWFTLLGLASLCLTYLGLQMGATVLVMAPEMIGNSSPDVGEVTKLLMKDGKAFGIFISAGWITVLLLLALCRPQSRGSWQLRLGLASQPLRVSLLWGAGGAVAFFLMGWLLDQFMDEKSRQALAWLALGRESPVLWLTAMVLVAPVTEELVFRGYAFAGWINKISPIGTILATAACFAAIHLQYGWAGLLCVFGFGLILGTVRWRTGNIYAGIVLHMLANLWFCLSVAWK
ncbi:hypothetical protein BH09VER1_BH09VER1_15400 [soil metagenome]